MKYLGKSEQGVHPLRIHALIFLFYLDPAEAAAFHYYFAVNSYWPEIDAFLEMYRIRMEKFRQENYYNEHSAWFCLVSEIRINAERTREKREAEERKRRAAYAAGRRSMFSDDRDDSAPSGSRYQQFHQGAQQSRN